MGHSKMYSLRSNCIVLGLMFILLGLDATPQGRGRAQSTERAPSAEVNYGCQCSNLVYRDENKKVHGNCESLDSDAEWCFVGAGSTCQDIQTTQRGPYTNKGWSYEACATPADPTNPKPVKPVIPTPTPSPPTPSPPTPPPSTGDCPNGWKLFETRAPSAVTNCGCKCSNLMCEDNDGKVHGNCKSAKSGAQWCFVEAGGSCQDIQSSDTKDWSWEACAAPSVCPGETASG